MKTEILRVQRLSAERAYGCNLEDVYLNLYEGESLGIVGFHNSGKSFLLDCLCGKARIREGRIFFYEEAKDAAAWAGSIKITRIWKKSALEEDMSVLENIFILQNKSQVFIPWKAIRREAEKCMDEFEISIALDTKVWELSQMERHMVELIRAYVTGATLVLIDDVMKSYTSKEYDKIGRLIRKMQKKGIAFIISGCHMEGMQRLTERCVFMVNGHIVKMMENTRQKRVDDIRIMMGMVPREKVYRHIPKKKGRVLFETDGFKVGDNRNLSFQIREGEIGILFDPFYQSGEALVRAVKEGKGDAALWVDGKTLKKSRSDVVVADFVNDQMVIDGLGIRDNLCLSSYQRISKIGLISKRKAAVVEKLFREQYVPLEMEFEEVTEKMDFAKRIAIYLERLKLRKWDVMFCINLENVMDYKTENIIWKQLEEMADKGRTICICSSSFEKFCELASCYFIVMESGEVRKMTYEELIEYFEI